MLGFLPINEDLSELLSLLNSHGVEFLVVGAHALAFMGFLVSRRMSAFSSVAASKTFPDSRQPSANLEWISPRVHSRKW